MVESADRQFCDIASDLGMIDSGEADASLGQQRVDAAIGASKPVGAYLHEVGKLSKDQIAQILKVYDRILAAAGVGTDRSRGRGESD